MKTTNLITYFLTIVLSIYARSTLADLHDVFGTFLTEEKNSHVEIVDCGDGSPCGRVVWLDPNKLDPGNTPENAKTKSGAKVLGLLILQGFERKGSDWRNGIIYAPDEDKSYASRLRRLEDGNLQVKGCISFLCQTQIWTPAPKITQSAATLVE